MPEVRGPGVQHWNLSGRQPGASPFYVSVRFDLELYDWAAQRRGAVLEDQGTQ